MDVNDLLVVNFATIYEKNTLMALYSLSLHSRRHDFKCRTVL